MICEAMGTAEDLVVAGVNSQFGQQVVHTNKQVEADLKFVATVATGGRVKFLSAV